MHRHTQIPTDTHAGTGLGRELLILHKAGPLRGAPRHRGPLLTKPPAGSKSDLPSRLQRGQGTRLPCPPPPPRSAPMLRSGRGSGCPAAARRVNLLLPRGCIGRPAPGRAATPCGPRRPKTQPARARCTAADAAACAPSAGLGRSVSPAFRSPVPRPTLPRLARALSLPGTAYRPRQGPSATKGRLSQRSIRFPSSSPTHIFQGLQSATLEPPLSTHGPHSQSCEARFSSIAPPVPAIPFSYLIIL